MKHSIKLVLSTGAVAAAAAMLLIAPTAGPSSPSLAHAGDGDMCLAADNTGDTLDAYAYLRALSLDLRGVVPEASEYDLLVDGQVPDSLIDQWLDTADFAQRVVRHHNSLFWPNVSDIRLLSNRSRMIKEDGIWYRYLVAPQYRGGPVHCGDFEATFDADGEIQTTVDSNGYLQEGWVMVAPYWDPDNPVKVCAFEAQPDLVSPWGTPCDGYDSRFDPHCGCGPNLAWCDTSELHIAPVHDALGEDLERRVARVIEEDLPYTELLTGRTAFVNGPLVHFYKHQIRIPAHVRLNDIPIDTDILPDLDFTDADTWVAIELGEEQAGVLTSPAFLMKFQTNRSRANRFYNAFLCQPFQPPADGIPGLDAGDATLDLTQRPGCKYCHTLLEPSAAYWGRWTEAGAGYLAPETYPAFNPDCQWCTFTGSSCPDECRRYYVTETLASEEDPFIGWLGSYEFRETQHYAHVEEGPKMLVHRSLADGRLPQCVASKAAGWLLGREPRAGEQEWVTDVAARFQQSGFQYKQLVKAIVTSDQYRRAF